MCSPNDGNHSETKKVVVIGKGRFGTAAAQGLRESSVYDEKGFLHPTDVYHVSARTFTTCSIVDMAKQLEGSSFVVYCGYRLPKYATKIAFAMKEARQNGSGDGMAEMEFIDFSNPDPIHEKKDLTGAIDVWRALSETSDSEAVGPSYSNEAQWKVWKITEVGSLDVAGTEGTSKAVVYGAGTSVGKVPKLKMSNLTLVAAPDDSNDLFEEARSRIMERSEIDRWYDGLILSMAMFIFTGTYAICRYHEKLNGSEPTAQIPMYLLDKAFAWTGLWMMVVSPFAGNLLAIGSLFGRFGSLGFVDMVVTLLAAVLMIIPVVFFSITYVLWIFLRNMFFLRRGHVSLYSNQALEPTSSSAHLKSTLVDMVSLKGETGCVGFAYALIHSFIGLVVCDVSYKGYWFNEMTGRLNWNMELCMMTGCVSTVILWAVAMRSLMGKATWIRLKPLYAYASPIGMWFAVVHVMAFGAKGWNTLFNGDYHNGQMSITFVSSMYPACVLLVYHLFGTFGTKKRVSEIHLWRHSLTSIATQDFINLREGKTADGVLNFTNHSTSTGMGAYLTDSNHPQYANIGK